MALLVRAEQLDGNSFFAMYGDVLMRSAHILAPYVNHQRETRGEQFVLPFSQLVDQLLVDWPKRTRRGRYPEVIAFKYGAGEISAESMRADVDVALFVAPVSGREGRWRARR